MPLGIPIPDNVAELGLDELHALHARIWGERTELKGKQQQLKPFIDVRQAQKNAETRAGFDTVIAQGRTPLNVTPATAKEMLEQAKAGAITLGKAMLDRLKQIAGGGE